LIHVTKIAALAFLAAMSPMIAVAAAPDATEEFLVFCKSDAKGCEDEILRIYKASLLAEPGVICATKVQLKDRVALRTAVTGWMANRPNLSRIPTLDSVAEAFKAVYPCR
jgi:hypothetical protein